MSIKAYFSFDGTKDEKSLYNHIFYCEGNMTSHDEAIIVMPGEYSDFYTEDYSSNIDVDVNGIQYKTVTDVLKNSVEVIFSIYQTDAPAYKYVVSISNSDGFADALEQLKSNNIDVEVGTRVHHKDYGDATVTDIVREDGKRLAILEFDDNDASIPKGQYRIEIPWGFHAGVLSLISSPQQNVNHIEDDAFIKEILLSGTWFYIENKDNWWKFNGDGSGQLTDFADFSWSVDKGVLSIDWSFSEAISQYYLTEEGGSYYLCSIEDTKKCASLSK